MAFRSLSTVALSALSVVQALTPAYSCGSNGSLSCHNTTAQNTCCFNAPGGTLLQVQLWDTSPSAGPTDSWTIHGLWPDECNGSYTEYCDESRQYSNISQIVQEMNSTLYSDMETYWPSNEGSASSFWNHEWDAHGTCVSTLYPDCFDDYSVGDEVPLFFSTVVDLFMTLPTYKWLSDAGITPSNSKTYEASDIISALSKAFGDTVYISCSSGTIESVEYYFNVRGTAQDGTYVPTASTSSSSCSGQVSYPPK